MLRTCMPSYVIIFCLLIVLGLPESTLWSQCDFSSSNFGSSQRLQRSTSRIHTYHPIKNNCHTHCQTFPLAPF
ncbi:hypothetical protein ARMGADRAFT_549312 [Armillaria gallica]|uniref:Secreted protein n=1 Tax=Armillaria gallica TaxID=47427 RepID=A0A2H3CRJ5_ARMGA|nr:hypothetical protein ARMGADRAFT_549312 [Armillaria gallica]